MRLWHQVLLPYLSNKRLYGQHRECCALRGKGWGRKHKTVDYVFTHDYFYLVMYHIEVMKEMKRRGIMYETLWEYGSYRGRNCGPYLKPSSTDTAIYLANVCLHGKSIYPEHNDAYLKECLELLDKKGEHIEWKQEQK